MLRPILPAWVPSIARFWPNSRPRKNVHDGAVTFIAGTPHEFLRILSQQEGPADTNSIEAMATVDTPTRLLSAKILTNDMASAQNKPKRPKGRNSTHHTLAPQSPSIRPVKAALPTA